MESLQVVIEQGDRIGVDYPAELKPAERIPEPKAIRQALAILKTALHHFDAHFDAEAAQRVYNLQVGENSISFYIKEWPAEKFACANI